MIFQGNIVMRGKISESTREYIEELREAIKANEFFADEFVTIDDQLMTAKQAIYLLDSNDLTSRTYRARQSK